VFLGRDDPFQSAEIAVVKQPADHVVGDLPSALFAKLMADSEVESLIEPGDRGLHAGLNERRGLDNHYAGSPAVGVTIVQPKHRHRINVAVGPAYWGGGSLSLVARPTLPEGLIGAPSMAKSLPRARINDVVP
jgi:hypothetical protein